MTTKKSKLTIECCDSWCKIDGMPTYSELLEALKRVRHAFYVEGNSKALRAAFKGTKELVEKAERTI